MNGILLIDKPEGMTSHDVVSRVRRVAGTRRVGHAGTLDPFATGVLVVCVGRATRLVQFLVGVEKQYIATIRLGFSTDTQDITGKQIGPLATSNELSLEQLNSVLEGFKGRQLQLPPMFSAKKVAGERLYRAARAGREVERKAVEITVHDIELIEQGDDLLAMNEDGTRDFRVRVRCSSGTYIRTLAHDIGGRLGVGAHLAALRRTAVGKFEIVDALTLDEMNKVAMEGKLEGALLSMAGALPHLPLVTIDPGRAELLRNGREIALTPEEAEAVGTVELTVRLCDERSSLIAVGRLDAARNRARPLVVLEAGSAEPGARAGASK